MRQTLSHVTYQAGGGTASPRKRPLMHIVCQRQHDVPVAAGCSLDKNLDQRPMRLQQASPAGTSSKVGLDVMPIDSVTPSDGHDPGERARSRRYLRG